MQRRACIRDAHLEEEEEGIRRELEGEEGTGALVIPFSFIATPYMTQTQCELQGRL